MPLQNRDIYEHYAEPRIAFSISRFENFVGMLQHPLRLVAFLSGQTHSKVYFGFSVALTFNPFILLVHFKRPPHLLFQAALVHRAQPAGGLVVRFEVLRVRRAARDGPRVRDAAQRHVLQPARRRERRRRPRAGRQEQIAAVGLGALLVFLGIATLSPLFARRLAGAIGAPLPRLFGVTGKLARENSTRSPRRTAATAAALMVGLALVTLVAMFASSLKSSIDAALTRTMKADLIVTPPSMMSMTGFSPEVARRLEGLQEIGVVSRFRFGEFEGADGNRRFLLAVDPKTVAQVMELDMISGSVSDLEDGGVLLRRVEAENLGLAAGDTLEMKFGNTGVRQVAVAGVFDASMDDRYLLSMRTFDRNFGRQDDIQLHLAVAPGMSLEQAETAVDHALVSFPNVKVLNQAAFREESGQMIDQMLNLVFALLALALITAILGITNTLALSVYERKRELGLLRAVGATKAQVRKMIRWEAATIALFGTALGVVIGVVFGWALISALADEGFSEIVVPVSNIVAFVVIAGLAGLLAAVLPARRAARVDVLEAIAFE